MSAATENKETKKQVTSIPAFVIEADHPRNCDLLFQAVPNLRLRSIISSSRTVVDARTGEEMVPVDQASGLGSLPQIPGMKLAVNPSSGEYHVHDPLIDSPELCERIGRRLKARTGSDTGPIKGVPDQRGTIDIHTMKTLCRECVWRVEAGDARVVKGVLPTLEDIEDMPGRFLLNPGARIQSMQPRYEDEYEAWKTNLDRVGG